MSLFKFLKVNAYTIKSKSIHVASFYMVHKANTTKVHIELTSNIYMTPEVSLYQMMFKVQYITSSNWWVYEIEPTLSAYPLIVSRSHGPWPWLGLEETPAALINDVQVPEDARQWMCPCTMSDISIAQHMTCECRSISSTRPMHRMQRRSSQSIALLDVEDVCTCLHYLHDACAIQGQKSRVMCVCGVYQMDSNKNG